MTIQIIKEPDIHLTQADHDKLKREWEQSNMYTTAPVSFEVFVRQSKESNQ